MVTEIPMIGVNPEFTIKLILDAALVYRKLQDTCKSVCFLAQIIISVANINPKSNHSCIYVERRLKDELNV